jgi:hypothetical protein
MEKITSTFSKEEIGLILLKVLESHKVDLDNYKVFGQRVTDAWNDLFKVLDINFIISETEMFMGYEIKKKRNSPVLPSLMFRLLKPEDDINKNFKRSFDALFFDGDLKIDVRFAYPTSICNIIVKNGTLLLNKKFSEFYKGLVIHKEWVRDNIHKDGWIFAKVILNSAYGFIITGRIEFINLKTKELDIPNRDFYDLMNNNKDLMRAAYVDAILFDNDKNMAEMINILKENNYDYIK